MAKKQDIVPGTGPLGTPDEFPVTTPRGFRADDHSWILQTIMELQKSSGQMMQAIATLTEKVGEQGKKLDSMSHRMYATAAVLTALGTILYFFLDRMWARILAVLQALPPGN